MHILRLDGAEIAYGARKLLDGASLVLQAGERVALVGRNGAGKSTLLKVLASAATLDDGTLWTADHLTISHLAQSVPDTADETIYQIVVGGLGALGVALEAYHALANNAGNAASGEMARLDAQIETLGGWNVEQRVQRVLDEMALPADLPLADASGGLRRRAMLARALVAEPDLLLLDEPTNHLDIPAIDALQTMLLATPATVVVVTHDRALIDNVATRVVEVDRGQLVSHPGSYSAYLAAQELASAHEARAERKFDQNLAREEAWIRQGIKARRTRNEGRVRRLEALRRERAARQTRTGSARLRLDDRARSGQRVVDLDDVSFGYEHALIRNFSTSILRGDRVGIIGANGSGKSTLLRLILGELVPDEGTVTPGTRLEVAYFDQQRAQLDESATVRDSVGEGSDTVTVGGRARHVAGYLGDFLFPGDQLNAPVSTLSGGEKNRLLMARLFARPANVLVLDEPTNDLDVETLELLEELLADFGGTLLLVTHDRAFLDAVVTSTVVFEADGRVAEYVGGYSDWQRQSAREATQRKAVAPDAHNREAGRRKVRNQARSPRLGFNEKRELAALPDRIEALEAEQAALQKQVSDPDFYRQDKPAIQAALARVGDLDSEIEGAYARWEALAALDPDG